MGALGAILEATYHDQEETSLALIRGKRIPGPRNKKEEGSETKTCLPSSKSSEKDGMAEEVMVSRGEKMKSDTIGMG